MTDLGRCRTCEKVEREVKLKPLTMTFRVRRKNNVWRLIFAFLIATLRFVGIWHVPGLATRIMKTSRMRRLGLFLTRRMLQIDVAHEGLERLTHPNCRMTPVNLFSQRQKKARSGMTRRELYVQLATSCTEELAARWLPFTLLPMKDILQTNNWFWVSIFGLAFGIAHLVTYREWHKIVFMAAAGVVLNSIYVFVVPQGWNLLTAIALHFIARLIGIWWRRRTR